MDNKGRPIYTQGFGHCDLADAFKLHSPEKLIEHSLVAFQERQFKFVYPALTKHYGRQIENGLAIIDLNFRLPNMVNR